MTPRFNGTDFEESEQAREPVNPVGQPASAWRLKVGIGIFMLSIALPIFGVPLVASLGLSTALSASISGGLLVAAEVLGIVAVAVMGRSGYVHLKERFLGLWRRLGPPGVVSRHRYTVGLVMFFLPILFAWVSVYAAEWIPGFVENPLPYAVTGDLMLVSGLFVLGGGFWDKVRALFTYDARVEWSPSVTPTPDAREGSHARE